VARRLVSWLAGAILFVFVWWVLSVIVGTTISSGVFTVAAAILLARQYRKRRLSRDIARR
jgi:hypothetical protein